MALTPRNEALAQLIEESTVSRRTLAADVQRIAAQHGQQVHTNHSNVTKWVNGVPPQPDTQQFLREALSRRLGRSLTACDLGMPNMDESPASGLSWDGDPVQALSVLGRGDMERRSAVIGLVYSATAAGLPVRIAEAQDRKRRASAGGRIDAADVAAFQEMTEYLTRVDERRGGHHQRRAVLVHLDDALDLCQNGSFAAPQVHRDMLSATAGLVCLAAWKAYDGGEFGLAQAYYGRAQQLTQEAGNAAHEAFVLRARVHHAINVRTPSGALAMADAMMRRGQGKVDASTLALFTVCRARALGETGQGTQALEEAERAREIVRRGETGGMPGWSALWGPAGATVNSHRAKIFAATGRYADAERAYGSAVAGRTEQTYRRINGLTLKSKGDMQLTQGRLEEALATYRKSLRTMEDVRSARTLKSAQGMQRALAPYRRRGAEVIGDFDAELSGWLQAQRAV